MKIKHTQQAGFGVVEVLLAVAVVLVLGGASYLVYHAHHKKTPVSTSAVTKQPAKPTQKTGSTTTKPSTPAVAYFTVKEWGVQAPYSGSDLSYSAAPNDSSTMLLESKNIDGEGSSCAADGNAGRISRYLPTDTIPGIPPEPTAQEYVSQNFAASNSAPPSYAKVGNYYYIYWASTADCSTDGTVTNQATAAAADIVSHLAAAQ